MQKSIYIMALGAFGIITTEFGVIGIMPEIARDFHLSVETAGWLLSGFALTIALTAPFSVLATSRINRRNIMALVLLLFVISNIISALAPNFTILMIARILPAILHPVFWSASTVAAAKQVDPKDAPKAVSIVLAGLSIATVLGIPLTSYIAEITDWRISFLVAGGINLIACILLLTKVPSMPVTEILTIKDQVNGIKSKQLWITLFATVIMVAGMFSSYGYMADFLEKITHMNGTDISLMLLIFGAAGIIGNWLTGIALSRNILFTTRVFLLLLIVAQILAFYFGSWYKPMVGVLAFWGFIHTGGFLIGQIRTTSEAPDAPELAASLMVSCGNAGITIGTVLGGFAIAHWGTDKIVYVSAVLLFVSFILSYIKFTDAKNITNMEIQAVSIH